jgi:putative spermidine/putrescine transport system permease protein
MRLELGPGRNAPAAPPRPFGLRRIRLPVTALLLLPANIIIAILLILPVGYILLLSFNPPFTGAIDLTSEISLQNYARLFFDSFYLTVLLRSILIAGVTTLMAAAAGYVLALSLWRAPPALKSYLVVLVLAPLLISIVARTYGWMIVLGDRGILNDLLLALGLVRSPIHIIFTRSAIVIGLLHVFLPFMALSILSSLERIDPAVSEAAKMLGAGPFALNWHVLIPLAAPGFAAGVTIVFSLSISAYVTPILMGGGGADVVTTLIFQQFMVVYNWHFGAALTMFLLATSLAILSAILYIAGRLTQAWLTAR